jgi:hypothetical protein
MYSILLKFFEEIRGSRGQGCHLCLWPKISAAGGKNRNLYVMVGYLQFFVTTIGNEQIWSCMC